MSTKEKGESYKTNKLGKERERDFEKEYPITKGLKLNESLSIRKRSFISEADLFGGIDLRRFRVFMDIGIGGADRESQLHLKLLSLQQAEITNDAVFAVVDRGSGGGGARFGIGSTTIEGGSENRRRRRRDVVDGGGRGGGGGATDVKLSEGPDWGFNNARGGGLDQF
ncbi:hypothetical protein PIB30_007028 [Stylosanthes scabra]|uniref:Uncharacterized protein n=1 Tax=Stylosanthes scabra TaxID=79078 RepID=A0ABU6Q4E2_9FABA|nr:hypothetical protein [Stylosanthes scabra]